MRSILKHLVDSATSEYLFTLEFFRVSVPCYYCPYTHVLCILYTFYAVMHATKRSVSLQLMQIHVIHRTAQTAFVLAFR
jgi:uncharacterized membrane protein